MKKKNVFVFYGGESVERDISVITALQTMDNMDYTKYNVYPIFICEDRFFLVAKYSDIRQYICFEKSEYKEIVFKKDVAYFLKNNKLKNYCRKIDCALLCVHGGKYEGGALQGFLSFNGIPLTSCDVFSSSLCQSKRRLKGFLVGSNVSTVPSFFLNDLNDLKSISSCLNFENNAYIVKPDSLGSSIGISVVYDKKQLQDAVELAFIYDREVLVEKYVSNAKEFNCAVVKTKDGYVSGKVDRVVSNKSFLTFDEKYLSCGKYTSRTEHAAVVEKELSDRIKTLAVETAELVGSSGVIRCDFLVDEGGKIYLNEVNSIPGSLAFYLFDFDFRTLNEILIETAIQDYALKNGKLKSFSTSYLDKNISMKK